MTTKSDGDTLTKAKEQRAAPAAESGAGRATHQRRTTMSVQETFEAAPARKRVAPIQSRTSKARRGATPPTRKTLSELVAELEAATNELSNARQVATPLRERVRDLRSQREPTPAAVAAAREAVAIPEILQVPDNPIARMVIHYADGTVKEHNTGSAMTVRAMTTAEATAAFEGQPQKQRAAFSALNRLNSARRAAERALYGADVALAERMSEEASKPVYAASRRVETALKAVWRYKATDDEVWAQIRALMQYQGADFDAGRGFERIDTDTEEGATVVALALNACRRAAQASAHNADLSHVRLNAR